jgi:hypothetical protein
MPIDEHPNVIARTGNGCGRDRHAAGHRGPPLVAMKARSKTKKPDAREDPARDRFDGDSHLHVRHHPTLLFGPPLPIVEKVFFH